MNAGEARGDVRIGVDIGGTFTDLVLIAPGGRMSFAKVSSTPAHPEEAVLSGIASVLDEAGVGAEDVAEVLHGTTVGSNTLLQKVGACAGLITTRGFRDVLEIGRIRTPEMFDLSWDKPLPLVPRRRRLEVTERIAADGGVVAPLAEDEVIAAGDRLITDGAESIAICFINSYLNGAHEIRAEAILRERHPGIAITTSVSVLPEEKEYERTSTTVVNAYVLPVMRAYLDRLSQGLRRIGVRAPLLVVTSNGGLATVAIAAEKPVFFISSGPAAGVVGAARAGRAAGIEDLVVFDMGGTTAKASLVRGGAVMRANEYEFRAGISTPSRFIKAGGYMMKVPTVDIGEVGSGAGSIARIDAGGLLHVGPESAGADPGPACYGLGGDRPTVTDCNVVLGLLNPQTLAGGRLVIDAGRARAVVERDLAKPLGLSVEDAANGVREVVDVNMARAIRAVTVERGIDPRELALIAFGGSGPVHAVDLARTLGMRRVLIPVLPGVFTALGMLTSDVERHFVRAMPALLRALDPAAARDAIAAMEAEARAALAEEGYVDARVALRHEADLRFAGQDSELTVPFEPPFDADTREALRRRFHSDYERVYQYVARDEVELVNLRLVARGLQEHRLDFHAMEVREAESGASGSRPVHFGREVGWIETEVVARAAIDRAMPGPLVIESADTTIVVPPDVAIAPDDAGNLVITV